MVWDALSTIAGNIGMGLENVILFVLVVGCMIFFAKDFKVGCLGLMLTSGLCFMLFYYLDWYWLPSVIVFFMSLVVLSFSLYGVSQVSEKGGVT